MEEFSKLTLCMFFAKQNRRLGIGGESNAALWSNNIVEAISSCLLARKEKDVASFVGKAKN